MALKELDERVEDFMERVKKVVERPESMGVLELQDTLDERIKNESEYCMREKDSGDRGMCYDHAVAPLKKLQAELKELLNEGLIK